MANPAWKPMDKRQQSVRIQRKAGVRCGYKDGSAGPDHLLDESLLVGATSDMFDHGIRKADVEGVRLEGKASPVRDYEPDFRKGALKRRHDDRCNSGDALGPLVVGFEEVAGAPRRVGHTDVQDQVRRLGLDDPEETGHTPTPRSGGEARRETPSDAPRQLRRRFWRMTYGNVLGGRHEPVRLGWWDGANYRTWQWADSRCIDIDQKPDATLPSVYSSCMQLEFVVVAYRSSRELRGCLDSIAADAPAGSRVVVVDNASPDDSAEVAASHPSGPRVVVSPKNLGFGGGCNLGAAGSDADALFFLNPDARLKPGATALLISGIEVEASLAVVAPRVVDPSGESRASSAGAEPSIRSSLGHFLALGRLPWIRRFFSPLCLADGRMRTNPDWVSGAAMLVRKRAYEDVGGFDGRIFMYMEDVDLCRRLREKGWAIGYQPEAVVEHVMGHSQSTEQPIRWYRAYHVYIAEHRGALHARAASLVAAFGLSLRAVAYRVDRPVNSARMARSARAALRFAFFPPEADVPPQSTVGRAHNGANDRSDP